MEWALATSRILNKLIGDSPSTVFCALRAVIQCSNTMLYLQEWMGRVRKIAQNTLHI